MDSTSNGAVKLIAALAMLGLAGFMAYRFFSADTGVSEKAFFYDLSEKKLFVAARGLVPPIRGINDGTEDGVRAVVISTNGKPEQVSSRRIAYLEKMTPELKQQMEVARSSGSSPAMGRSAAQGHRLVKRVEDAEWVSLLSAEGERIVSEWAVPGPDGNTPVVCSP